MPRRRAIACAAVFLLLAALAWTGPTARAEEASARSAEAAATVNMTNALKYEPREVTISAGETILWRNGSALVHTVTADPALAAKDGSVSLPAGAERFHSGNIEPGGTYRRTFSEPGRYKYFCVPHEAAGMTGVVIVEE